MKRVMFVFALLAGLASFVPGPASAQQGGVNRHHHSSTMKYANRPVYRHNYRHGYSARYGYGSRFAYRSQFGYRGSFYRTPRPYYGAHMARRYGYSYPSAQVYSTDRMYAQPYETQQLYAEPQTYAAQPQVIQAPPVVVQPQPIVIQQPVIVQQPVVIQQPVLQTQPYPYWQQTYSYGAYGHRGCGGCRSGWGH